MTIRIGNIRTYKPKTNEIAIKVDRSNKILGNKFIMRNESQRDKVCDQYDIWIHNEIKKNNTDVINSLLNIKKLAQNNDIVLLCWCAPKRCHAETIKKIVEDDMILECSSKGDKRFSALYAKVKVFGVYDSIENHYQNCKRDINNQVVGKGKKVYKMVIEKTKETIELPPSFLTAYYKLLWCAYLDANPNLVEYASRFNDYHDTFKGKAINCQADVIRQYIKIGRSSILLEPDVKQLRRILKI